MATDIKPLSLFSYYQVVPSALTDAPVIPYPWSVVPGGWRYTEG